MANSKILEAKQEVINEITDVVKNNASFILFDYRGLTAEETTLLRKKLRENNATYKVWKNTLTKRAMDSLDIDLDSCLEGPSAMAYSNDSVAPIKVLSEFKKEHPALEIKGGLVDGKVATLDEIKVLASLPSRETLLAMLASALIGTVRNLSIALNMLSEKKENE